MKRVEIPHRWRGEAVYVAEVEDDDPNPLRTAVVMAVCSRANLTRANLRGADLEGANLRGADLEGANLTGANLRGANLRGADLEGANLTGANLTGANLRGADLTRADLRGANLTGANLRGANLRGIRDDIRLILDITPAEVPGLLAKLRAGEIDGSCYEGACACLVGTVANLRACHYTNIPGLAPDSSRPAERWFTGIGRGATPDNNPVAAITDDWICEWLAERGQGEWIQ